MPFMHALACHLKHACAGAGNGALMAGMPTLGLGAGQQLPGQLPHQPGQGQHMLSAGGPSTQGDPSQLYYGLYFGQQ